MTTRIAPRGDLLNEALVSSADNDVRYVPSVSSAGGHSAVAHESRYQWVVQNFALENLRVLDFGCGSGYGANLVAQRARSVDAVDYSRTAIEYAKVSFPSPNLKFLAADACSRETPELLERQRFDLILSFDVIEHLERYFEYMENIVDLLQDDGVLIIGCPNRLQCFEWNRQWNPYHVQEFSPHQFRRILSSIFGSVVLFAQDFEDPQKREAARLQNRGTDSPLREVVRQALPLPALRAAKAIRNFVKSVRQGNSTAAFQSSDIRFWREPGDQLLRSAFGIVAVCSGATLPRLRTT
jgi:2-polyprenyl-3-methyl-5-hydroxy-6-metoxy-1,4-benzoquinol methylase